MNQTGDYLTGLTMWDVQSHRYNKNRLTRKLFFQFIICPKTVNSKFSITPYPIPKILVLFGGLQFLLFKLYNWFP